MRALQLNRGAKGEGRVQLNRAVWARTPRAVILLMCWLLAGAPGQAAGLPAPALDQACAPPAEWTNQFGSYSPLLQFSDGRAVQTPADWAQRRQELLAYWHTVMGPWPELIERPKVEVLASTQRGDLKQQKVRIESAPGRMEEGWLLIPPGEGPFPAVLVPYYEPETSIGLSTQELRDFGYQLAQRGCVTLSIGSPGGDARKPEMSGAACQPLSFLAYVAANCHTALAQMTKVDPARIGIVGHSYGGKWAMFAACLYEKFACGAWSDPGIVFDESRPNVNYWEPWYLGSDPARQRKPGVPTPANPRTGAYEQLVSEGRDLHELLALMAPRPFLVSGGSEDPPERWMALNRVNEVYALLGAKGQVCMTHRKEHNPSPESNAQIHAFFTQLLLLQKTGK